MSQGATSPRPPAAAVVHPFEALLHLIDSTAPKPWYPRTDGPTSGVHPALLNFYLENLWLDGLVKKAEGTPETGPGLTLSPLGREVLDNPAALQRLKEGRPVVEGSQGGVVRECVRRPPRPTVTWGLMAVSVAVFLYGLARAPALNVGLEECFVGGPRAFLVADALGAMITGEAWLRGEWQRLATSCFIHVGVLQLLIALLFLYRVAARGEQMWGRVRFLILFLTSGIGGNLIGMALEPQFLIPGVWSGVYGLLGAEAVWVLCNDRHLPRAVASRMRTQVAWDAVMVGLCLVFPWLNRWTEFGGAVVGLGVGLVLQVQRFGPSPWRWLVLAVLPPLPWLGWTFINHERATNPEWAGLANPAPANPGNPAANAPADDERAKKEAADEEEWKAFKDAFYNRIHDRTNEAYYGVYDKEGGILDLPPDARDKPRVEKMRAHLDDKLGELKQLEDDLAAAGPYNGEPAKEAHKAAIQFVRAVDDLLTTAKARLTVAAEWTPEDEAKAKKVKDAATDFFRLMK